MSLRLDHVVLWVEDPLRSLQFYCDVVGLTGVRVEEYRDGRAPFPSVRVASDSILDLMARSAAPLVDAMANAREPSAGHPVNHVCLAMDEAELTALRRRLVERGITVSAILEGSFGARGAAPRAFYFHDPDGNVLEARHY